jgi:hypothetical protein
LKLSGEQPAEAMGRFVRWILTTGDLILFKRAVQMLFERLESAREETGDWKLSKVIPREVFWEFF